MMLTDFAQGLELDLSQPIYLQIVAALKRAVARGDLVPGDQIPSQRELAERLQVNPNTVQRAYREMELERLVETLRGRGTFVVDNPSLFESIREDMAEAALSHCVQTLKELGFDERQIAERLHKHLYPLGNHPDHDFGAGEVQHGGE